MIKKTFPMDIKIDVFNKNILFGGDRKNGVIAYSVLYSNEIPIGVASLSVSGDFNSPEIVGVYVLEEYRRKGYAKELINELKVYYDTNISSRCGLESLCIQLINEDSAKLDTYCKDLGITVYSYKNR